MTWTTAPQADGHPRPAWIVMALMLFLCITRARAENVEIANVPVDGPIDCASLQFYITHDEGALDGHDANDIKESMALKFLGNDYIFRVFTTPYGTNLVQDARPNTSETTYECKLAVLDRWGNGPVTASNYLAFAFAPAPMTNRVYLAKIHLDAAYTANEKNFDRVVDIRKVVEAGGHVSLPSIVNVPNNQVYGTIAVSCKFLKKGRIHGVTIDGEAVTLDSAVLPSSFVGVEQSHTDKP